MKEEMHISGKPLDPFALHSILILTVPGSEIHERAVVDKTLVTSDGRLVFVTKPYQNLAEAK
jgi:hypothetical protein